MKALKALEQLTPIVQLRRWEHTGAARRYAEGAHDTFEIALVVEGRVRYSLGTRCIDVGAGQVVVVPANVSHVTTFRSAVAANAIQMCAERVRGLSEAAGLDAPTDAFVLRDGERSRALATLLRGEVESTRQGREITIDALCDALAIEVLREDGTSAMTHVDPRVRRAIEFVHDCYAQTIGVDDLARAAAMSRYHFSRRFRAQVGVSPYQYVQRVRIQRAAARLSLGEPVSTVAHAVGFPDLSRFARAFRKEMGCTPSHFLRRAA